jgi:hypothetical protein
MCALCTGWSDAMFFSSTACAVKVVGSAMHHHLEPGQTNTWQLWPQLAPTSSAAVVSRATATWLSVVLMCDVRVQRNRCTLLSFPPLSFLSCLC